MRKCFTLFGLLLLLAGCASSDGGKSARSTPVQPKPYTRVVYEGATKVQLQVSSRKFVSQNGRGPEVWLVGAMHVGEPEYYQALQKELDARTVVLYEGVNTGSHKRHAGKHVEPAEKEKPMRKPTGGEKPGYSVQSKLASALGLVFQLDAIDYDRTNFLNSDLSVDELQRIIAQGGPESADGGGKPNQSFEELLHIMDGNSFMGSLVKIGIEFIASNPKLQALTKLTLIETIGRLRGDLADMKALPPDLKQLVKVLIEARNRQVISDLKEQLKLLKHHHGSIAIFYGAGHMDNMEKLLATELDYHAAGEFWLDAFSVDLKKYGVSESEAQAARSLIEWQMKEMQGK